MAASPPFADEFLSFTEMMESSFLQEGYLPIRSTKET